MLVLEASIEENKLQHLSLKFSRGQVNNLDNNIRRDGRRQEDAGGPSSCGDYSLQGPDLALPSMKEVIY